MLSSLLGQKAALCGSPAPGGKPDVHDLSYYGKCCLGGILACGITHTAVCPIDIVKCRLQSIKDPIEKKKSGIGRMAKQLIAQKGYSWMSLGWLPTFFGYSLQGMGKFGFYELFKDVYGGMIGPDKAYEHRTLLYASASASAEFFADMMLCPLEAVKVKIQTADPLGSYPSNFFVAWRTLNQAEGFNGFYKGINALWGRQIPYTIMKFVAFEKIVEFIFTKVLKKERSEVSRSFNLTMTFVAGYLAGILCALVSHPADTMFTKLTKLDDKNSTFSANLKKIYAEIGFMGLWSGLIPRIIMIGTLTGLQWWIYDSFKTSMGLQPTGSNLKKH